MIWNEILAEREQQDEEHGGPPNDDRLSPSDWVGILTQYAGRAYSCARVGRPELYRQRLVEVAAVAVAAIESYDRLNARPVPAMPVPEAAPLCLSGG